MTEDLNDILSAVPPGTEFTLAQLEDYVSERMGVAIPISTLRAALKWGRWQSRLSSKPGPHVMRIWIAPPRADGSMP